MSELDFTETLTVLLSDGEARVRFAADPTAWIVSVGVAAADRSAVQQLDPEQVERQARVLIRKRQHAVGHSLPRTFSRLGGDLDSLFYAFASTAPARRPEAGGFTVAHSDSVQFSAFLRQRCPKALVAAEVERLHFSVGSGAFKMSFHRRLHVERTGRLWGTAPGLQILWRTSNGRLRELQWHLAPMARKLRPSPLDDSSGQAQRKSGKAVHDHS